MVLVLTMVLVLATLPPPTLLYTVTLGRRVEALLAESKGRSDH
jgi:hypothetical protein